MVRALQSAIPEDTMPNTALKASSVMALLLSTFAAASVTLPTTAQAAADDIFCIQYTDQNGEEQIDCETREDWLAECALSDPDHTSEHCQDVAESDPRRFAPAETLTDSQSTNQSTPIVPPEPPAQPDRSGETFEPREPKEDKPGATVEPRDTSTELQLR
jgi:hypothetical protein